MAENDRGRLFIGLPVSQAVRDVLWQYASGLTGCRAVRRDMYHITLCFLGCRDRGEIPALCRLLDTAPKAPLPLTLGTTGAFKNGDILWAGLKDPPSALFVLQRHLARALDMAEETYIPHITLARRAKDCIPGAILPPVSFSPDALILYESLREQDILTYKPLYAVPLAGR